jgi:hypothetical protein
VPVDLVYGINFINKPSFNSLNLNREIDSLMPTDAGSIHGSSVNPQTISDAYLNWNNVYTGIVSLMPIEDLSCVCPVIVRHAQWRSYRLEIMIFNLASTILKTTLVSCLCLIYWNFQLETLTVSCLCLIYWNFQLETLIVSCLCLIYWNFQLETLTVN